MSTIAWHSTLNISETGKGIYEIVVRWRRKEPTSRGSGDIWKSWAAVKAQRKLCSKQLMCVGGSTSGLSITWQLRILTSCHLANRLPSHPSHRSASVGGSVTTRGHGRRAMQSTIRPLLPWPASTCLCQRRRHSQSASSPLLADWSSNSVPDSMATVSTRWFFCTRTCRLSTFYIDLFLRRTISRRRYLRGTDYIGLLSITLFLLIFFCGR